MVLSVTVGEHGLVDDRVLGLRRRIQLADRPARHQVRRRRRGTGEGRWTRHAALMCLNSTASYWHAVSCVFVGSCVVPGLAEPLLKHAVGDGGCACAYGDCGPPTALTSGGQDATLTGCTLQPLPNGKASAATKSSGGFCRQGRAGWQAALTVFHHQRSFALIR